MYRSILIILVLGLCSFNGSNDTDQLVMGAARTGLTYFLDRIPRGQESAFGFSSQDAMHECTVGRPVRMITFNMDLYSGPPIAGKEYLLIRDEWRVPVALNGENRALATVDEDQGNFSVTGLGASVLAKELQQMVAEVSAGEQIYLLRVYSLRADFFVRSIDNSMSDAIYIPLTSVKSALPDVNKTSYTLTEVQNLVYQEYINNPEKN